MHSPTLPCPGEELPRPCPCCDFYHGTPAQSRVQYAAESARYETLASAALESTQGQRAFSWPVQTTLV